jgi:peptidoglycan/LPS O-acetylase OafA/YrhL
LALSVVASHTGFNLWINGRAAVTVFYIISGYLMTLVLNEMYRERVGSFYTNRLLRIFVPAIVVLVGSTLTFAMLGLRIPFLDRGGWPLLYNVFSNIFIVLQDFAWLLAIDPAGGFVWQPWQPDGDSGGATSLMIYQYNLPLFTIAIELYFYLAAPFIVRSMWRSLAFAWVGFLYHLSAKYFGFYSLAWNYQFFVASWFYFGSGAVSYWMFRRIVIKDGTPPSANVLPALACYGSLAIFVVGQLGFEQFALPVAYLICAFSLSGLLVISRELPLDDYVGKYSYPVYLVHWPLLNVVQATTPFGGGPGLFACVAAASLVVSAILHHGVEVPVDKLRARIRSGRKIIPNLRNCDSLTIPKSAEL